MTGTDATPNPAPRERLASDEAIRGATGRDWATWIALLDDWGASGREHAEITSWLAEVHHLQRWWARTIAVGYERERGRSEPGVRHDGTRAISVSRTIDASAADVSAAFTDTEIRERWLPGAVLRERASQPGRSVVYDWADGTTRVEVGFLVRGENKSQIALIHERLPDAETAEAQRSYWRDRLDELKRLLES